MTQAMQMTSSTLFLLALAGAVVLYAADSVADVLPVTTAQATWVVDPNVPGVDLPPAGRSLFDFLMTDGSGGATYQVPFPFEALRKKIEDRVQPDESGYSPVKQVLIPLGRALLRASAAPDFFKHPRLVAAVDTEPKLRNGQAGMLLKDRLYIGYGEKADTLEVISYNEAAGRFEFQIVKDYRPGGKPQVFYARRAVCTTCHQNAAAIFSRPLWDETNANPAIAAKLLQTRRDFYSVPVERGIDVPFAIDNAKNRSNLFSAYQLLWREGCEDSRDKAGSIRCRADAFTFMLQFRLSGSRFFDAGSGGYRDAFALILAKNWLERWPGGLYIPDPSIPNRNPLAPPPPDGKPLTLSPNAKAVQEQLRAQGALVPPQVDPLSPRPPLETWSASRPADIARLVAGLSEFIAEPDIRRLDQHLFERGARAGSARQLYRSTCEFTRKDGQASAWRSSFRCRGSAGATDSGFSMEGRIYTGTGKAVTGTIDRLAVRDKDVLQDLEVADGRIEVRDGQWRAELHVRRDGLHARQPDGRAVERLTLRWRMPARSPDQPFPGEAELAVMDDFSPVRAAIADMAAATEAGRLDAFSARPFRRAAVMPALFERLGMGRLAWCCLDAAGMPPAVVAEP